MTRLARLFGRRGADDSYKSAVGGHWEDVGRLQFDFLVSQGLEPHHRLLEVPCGSFRAGRFFIDYLMPGNYIGVEGDEALLATGVGEVLGDELIGRKRPTLLARWMPAELPPADIGWIHALFDHIPPDDARATIAHAAASTPRFFATFFLTDTPDEPKRWLRYGSDEGAITTYRDREYWHHSPQFVEDAAEAAGVSIAGWHDYRHPLGLTAVEFRRDSAPDAGQPA